MHQSVSLLNVILETVTVSHVGPVHSQFWSHWYFCFCILGTLVFFWIVSAPDEFRLTPYHSLQISTIKGTPEAQVPMATSTVERVREQTESEKEDKVVTGKEPEQQIEDEQWEFISRENERG